MQLIRIDANYRTVDGVQVLQFKGIFSGVIDVVVKLIPGLSAGLGEVRRVYVPIGQSCKLRTREFCNGREIEAYDCQKKSEKDTASYADIETNSPSQHLKKIHCGYLENKLRRLRLRINGRKDKDKDPADICPKQGSRYMEQHT